MNYLYKKATRLFLLLILIAVVSCEKPDISDDQNLVNDLYTNSTDTIIVGTNEYFLETSLSRNFMPGAFKNRSLVAVAYLVNADSLPISKYLSVTYLYVIKNGLVWISAPDVLHDAYLAEFKLGSVSNDGPEWETNIYVDVIAEISDRLTKDKYLIIARHQYIERAD